MKCILPAVNLKNFGKAIHCLAKIGFEVYIEVLDNGIELKTVNSSRSSYFCFHFYKSNFSYYDPSVNHTDGGGDNECFRCKVQMKTIMQVFKSLNSIEKSVEQCAIHLDQEESRLIFQLKCRHAITKTHHIHYQDCDSLQAKFAKDLCPNSLKCESKLLRDAAFNFHSSLEEISLSVTPCQVLLRSVPGDDDQITSMKTEMQLSPDEFLDFQVGVDTEVTFCLKDIRAILAFCEVASCPVQLSFESGGKPLIVSCEEERLFKANFVLATISAQFPAVIPDLPQTTMTSHRICNSTTMMSKKSNSSTATTSRTKKVVTNNKQNNNHHPRPTTQAEQPTTQEYGSVVDAFYQPSELNYSRVPQESRRVLAENSDYSTTDDDS